MIKKILLCIFTIILSLFVISKIVIENMVENVGHISISTSLLTNIKDGNYIGEYKINPVYVKVEVTINNCKISNIVILQHDNGLGSAAENIVYDIVKKQSLEIDTVSKATVSSKCILKAVENAIKKGEFNQ